MFRCFSYALILVVLTLPDGSSAADKEKVTPLDQSQAVMSEFQDCTKNFHVIQNMSRSVGERDSEEFYEKMYKLASRATVKFMRVDPHLRGECARSDCEKEMDTLEQQLKIRSEARWKKFHQLSSKDKARELAKLPKLLEKCLKFKPRFQRISSFAESLQ